MEARSHRRVEFLRCFFWVGCCALLTLGAHGELPDHPTSYTPPTLESLDCPSEVEPVHAPSNGPICGGTPKGYSGLRAFWGIPYAPDTSESRWMPPQPLDGSVMDPEGTPMEARAFGPWCPQIHQGELVGSEDCLRVNVWTPNVSGKLPVMVYIHGGAFIMGASDVPEPSTPKPKGQSKARPYGSNLYDGAYLSHTHDVVVVSMNYRVGAMGFLSNGKKKGDLGGNYGFMDQQAALHWVQKNISAFGGDPQQVTIFGESAGAMSVGLHMLSAPSSYDGKLFRAGIMQSNLPGLPYKTPQQGKGDFDTFATQVLKAEKSKAKTCDVKCLRAASLKNLLAAQSKTLPAFAKGQLEQFLPWTPVLDGKLITKQPVDGTFKQPAIFGTNANEGILFAAPIIDVASKKGGNRKKYAGSLTRVEYEQTLYEFFPGFADDIIGNYPYGPLLGKHHRYPTAQSFSRALTDYIFTCANHDLASKNAKGKESIYTYVFRQASSPRNYYVRDLPAGGCPGVGTSPPSKVSDSQALYCQCYSGIDTGARKTSENAVCHGAELPFVFNSPGYASQCKSSLTTGDTPCVFDDSQIEVARKMASFWATFAKDPSKAPDPSWSAFQSGSKKYMTFKADGTHAMEALPSSDHCDFWINTVQYPAKSDSTAVGDVLGWWLP